MQVFVNGEPRQLSDSATLADLVALMALADRRIAVEVNEELVTRSDYATQLLQAADRIEIVQAIGGG